MKLETVLQTIISISFLMLVFSTIASGIVEWLAAYRHLRPRLLKESLLVLLASTRKKSLAVYLFEHPIIEGLSIGGQFPSYIPAPHFAMALIELAIDTTGLTNTTKKVVVRDTIVNTSHKITFKEKQIIDALIAEETNIRVVQARIEKWFQDSMQRVTGVYKRRTNLALFFTALALAAAFNINLISLTWTSLNGQGQFQLGWTHSTFEWTTIPGVLFAAVGMSLGSPVWFELLNRFVNLRQSGPKSI